VGVVIGPFVNENRHIGQRAPLMATTAVLRQRHYVNPMKAVADAVKELTQGDTERC
jgi:hypothetical protein